MSYRLPDKRNHLVDVANESVISVDNGTISRISIPCIYSYFEGNCHHSRMMHDHLGWPSPDNPDWSCQLPPCEYDNIVTINEIDLDEEGYTSIVVSLLDPPTGLTVEGYIDRNMVNLVIVSLCNSVTKNDVEIPFTVYAVGLGYDTDGTQIPLRDIVIKGILHIVANPIG